ncbi:MAG: hypothetical protein R2827_16510 [Bdellovibrionales bacterium]
MKPLSEIYADSTEGYADEDDLDRLPVPDVFSDENSLITDAKDDVAILEEVSVVEEAPPGGFWVQKALADTLREMKPRLKSNNVQLKLAIEQSELFPVEGDFRHVATALKHIINNAIEASEESEEKVLKIKAIRYKDEIHLEVEDFGRVFLKLPLMRYFSLSTQLKTHRITQDWV